MDGGKRGGRGKDREEEKTAVSGCKINKLKEMPKARKPDNQDYQKGFKNVIEFLMKIWRKGIIRKIYFIGNRIQKVLNIR